VVSGLKCMVSDFKWVDFTVFGGVCISCSILFVLV
jgi:hypothetical protein